MFSRGGAAYSSGWCRSFGFRVAGCQELTAGLAVFVLVSARGRMAVPFIPMVLAAAGKRVVEEWEEKFRIMLSV
ncbi:hypothetical protein GCM10022630_32390 [Thermobifida alba]